MTQRQSFKPGDQVRCISPGGKTPKFSLAADKLYTVAAVRPTGSIELVDIPYAGLLPPAFMQDRFELVDAASPQMPLRWPVLDAPLDPGECACAACSALEPAPRLLDTGTRVVLTRDFSFYDEGDSGVIAALGHDGTCTVELDGGATALRVPLDALAAEIGDYRVMDGSAIGTLSYETEAEAAEAAEDGGLTVFTIVKLAVVAKYEVQVIPATTHVRREAA